MPRLSIVLAEDELAALADLAIREWREPRSQAGYIIANELRRAGVLPITITDYCEVQNQPDPRGPGAAA